MDTAHILPRMLSAYDGCKEETSTHGQ